MHIISKSVILFVILGVPLSKANRKIYESSMGKLFGGAQFPPTQRMYKCKDVLDVFWTSYKWSTYVLCPRGFIEVAATERLHNLNPCFGKINSPLKNRFSDSPRTSTFFKRCNFPRCSQCHHLRCLYLFHDGCRYHIETSPLINSANQWTGFYMITAPSWKS